MRTVHWNRADGLAIEAQGVTWHCVADAVFGSSDEPEICVGRGWFAWWLPPGLLGCSISGNVGVEETLRSMESWNAFQRHARAPFDIIAFMPPAHATQTWFEQFRPVVPNVEANLSPHLRRVAAIVDAHWGDLWWRGLFDQLGLTGKVARDAASAWECLEVDAAARSACHALLAEMQRRGAALTQLVETLAANPGADLATSAREIGRSARSLQRELATQGESFTKLRDRIRLEMAERLLAQGDKVTVVANEIGFSSASHFTIWFRRQTGRPPSLSAKREGTTTVLTKPLSVDAGNDSLLGPKPRQ